MKIFKVLLILLFPFSVFAQCGTTYFGEGTFYGYAGGGNCGFPAPELPAMTGAINHLQYEGSQMCGACVEVTGPEGTATIRIEDQCPECAYGDIDLAEDVFPLVAEVKDGRVPISWKIIPCEDNALQYQFKIGSSQFWFALQVRGHTYPIETLECKINGNWQIIERRAYNYFVQEQGLGAGPFAIRITDIYGNIVEDSIPGIDTVPILSSVQFTECIDDNLSRQSIPLDSGWNFVHLRIETENMLARSVFPNAITIKTEQDQFQQTHSPATNTIDSLIPFTPYLVNNSIKEVIELTGKPANKPDIILLSKGWNYMPYTGESFQWIRDYLAPLGDTVIAVKNFDAFWKPEINFNRLRYFSPGKAYFINVAEDCILYTN